jgi:hypothetical protein
LEEEKLTDRRTGGPSLQRYSPNFKKGSDKLMQVFPERGSLLIVRVYEL